MSVQAILRASRTAALGAIASVALWTSAPAGGAADPALPDFDATSSLLIIAPHPDDETLCCAGAIRRALSAGGRASVAWLTSGDGSELGLLMLEKSLFLNPAKMRDLAERRTREARNAAAALGIPESGLFFLGYPDRGLLELATDYYLTPYHSTFNGSSSVPYSFALSPGRPYTGESLERDLAEVLERVKPTLVLAPTPEDEHPDHRAGGIVAMRVLARIQPRPEVRYWIVHGGEGWPTPGGLHADLTQTPAPRARELLPQSLLLSSEEEARKLQALRAYESQIKVMSAYLLSFVRRTELYSTAPMPQPAAPGR